MGALCCERCGRYTQGSLCAGCLVDDAIEAIESLDDDEKRAVDLRALSSALAHGLCVVEDIESRLVLGDE